MPEDRKTVKVSWGLPAYKRGIDVGVAQQMLFFGLETPFVEQDTSYRFAGIDKADSCSVHYSRDLLIYTSMQRGNDWLIMSDADTYTVDAKGIWRMIATGEETGAALIGFPVFMRNGRGYNAMVKPGDRWAAHDEVAGKVQDVYRLGSGFIAVNLNWIREHYPTSPWFFESRPKSPVPQKIGSDVMFCEQLRLRQGRIVCDGRVIPTHVGVGQTGHPEVDDYVRQTHPDRIQQDEPGFRAVSA